MEHFKLSTSRDFRINGATLEAALQETEREDNADESISVNIYFLPLLHISRKLLKFIYKFKDIRL